MDTITQILLLLILVAVYRQNGAGSAARITALSYRLRRLERCVEAVALHLGVALPPEPVEGSPAVRQLVREGKQIKAIKLHRDETGLGLADAKAAVERIAASVADEEVFPEASGGVV